MRIRRGFVSNSSSSSFVVVGYRVSLDADAVMERLGIEDIDDLLEEFYLDDDIFGITLASLRSDDHDGDFEMDDVKDAFTIMRDMACKFGLDGDPKLILVNSYC